MFFFIGGISPKTVVLDESPQRCPACGLYQARLKRVDHYLNLFFIPVLRVKKGTPMLVCDRCRSVSPPQEGAEAPAAPAAPAPKCPRCGQPLEPDFRYCPRCGRRR